MAETLGVPYSSEQGWREDLSRQREDNFAVVACVQGEVVGYLALSPYPKTVILKKMSWGNVVEWCVNRLKL